MVPPSGSANGCYVHYILVAIVAAAQGYKYQTLHAICGDSLLRHLMDIHQQELIRRIKHLNHYTIVLLVSVQTHLYMYSASTFFKN